MKKWFKEARPYKGVRCFVKRRGNWLLDWFFMGVFAFTWRGCMYFCSRRAYRTHWLKEHEYHHIEQARNIWFFHLKYALATIWYGYDNNPYEAEARMVSGKEDFSNYNG